MRQLPTRISNVEEQDVSIIILLKDTSQLQK